MMTDQYTQVGTGVVLGDYTSKPEDGESTRTPLLKTILVRLTSENRVTPSKPVHRMVTFIKQA